MFAFWLDMELKLTKTCFNRACFKLYLFSQLSYDPMSFILLFSGSALSFTCSPN